MKTPIQIAIEKVNERVSISQKNSNELYQAGLIHSCEKEKHCRRGLLIAKEILTELLPTEKEQIEKAWNSAYGGDSNLDAEQYFTQTFKVNQ